MANLFVLILTIATALTGIVWCIDKLKRAGMRRKIEKHYSVENIDIIQDKKNVKKKPIGWRENIASLFPVLAIVFILRSFIYEPFQIPSGSMMPTLLIGDFILVQKFAYGIKEPLTQRTLIKTGEPKRGDIAVFKYPQDPRVDYIKRVIGLPGDTVIYDSEQKFLKVIPACENNTSCENSLPLTYSEIEPSKFVQVFITPDGRNAGNRFYSLPLSESLSGSLRLETRQETLDNRRHDILFIKEAYLSPTSYYQQPGQPMGTWVVPPGQYFMMGDNRDNSADSRYWGFVPEKYLVGKATAIWMSFEKQEGEWPTGVRLDRIGRIH